MRDYRRRRDKCDRICTGAEIDGTQRLYVLIEDKASALRHIRAFFPELQSKAFRHPIECSTIDAENFCSANLIVSRLLQDADEILFFQLLQTHQSACVSRQLD